MSNKRTYGIIRLETRIIPVFIAAVLLSSCVKYELEMENLLSEDSVSLIIKGSPAVEIASERIQVGYNDMKRQFRVHDDTFSNFFILTCDSDLSGQGDFVTADLQWTTSNNIRNLKGIKLEIKKTEGNKYWLWNKSHRVAIVIEKPV